MPISFALSSHSETDNMDSRFRGNDESVGAFAGPTSHLRADLVAAAVLGAIQRGVCLREQIFGAVDVR